MKDVEPQDGAEREHTFYAWWPVTVGRETRWLEWVTARQIYGMNTDKFSLPREWISVEFLD